MSATIPVSNSSTPIHEVLIDNETVIFLGEFALVRSNSQLGAWHEVRDGRCTCDGFRYRGTCRHLMPAAMAAEYDRQHSVAVEAVAAEPVVMTNYFRRVAGAYLNGEYR